MNDIPQSAYILPDEKTGYMAVWQTENRLVLRLLNGPKHNGHDFDVHLDKKILPHLVDALIELQNQ